MNDAEKQISGFDNRFSLARGRLHLGFELNKKRIGYCYIRKNACKSFKVAMGYKDGAEIGRAHV